MKRFLILLVVVALGAAVAAERMPALHARVPWLPNVPGLTVAAADKAADADGDGREGGGKRRRRFAADGPIPVLAERARTADVPVTADVLGTVQATNSVLVRSQIDGKLVEIDFREGQDVKRGDVVARIDPATYKALYDSAVAKKASDEALLSNAQVDLVRYAKLAETQYGSHQQADTQKALVAQYTAQIAQDQAAIDNAKATLDYATIRSPIDGRTGIRQVDAGNIVHASDSTGIVTIAQVKPIAAIFNLPQQWLRQVNGAAAKGTLRLVAHDGSTNDLLDTGTLQVIDNTVDQTTGTVKMKGSFPNADGQLWPGQFVNLRLYVDVLKNVVVVPTPAVQRGPDGPFVYRVEDGKAVMVKVQTGRQTEADTVVTAGLAPPAEVITTGFTRLTDGTKVAVSTATASANPAKPDAAKPAGDDKTAAPPAAEAGAAPDHAVDAKADAEAGGPEAVRRHRRRREGGQAGASN
ncbi:efflux RND transporter periplasmic adaptor subunit [Lichenibacterium dinghuense]|uniref:efflux RND transporter periplasmic adaptor subunit n=1 Tax=Lichenibacterium dinghuense TaxID=2895977 RepID=UPI001F02A434|nr:efflux RND transporter periplasmic adaptor subunit [Lichenibacterium sp. 6Y81]